MERADFAEAPMDLLTDSQELELIIFVAGFADVTAGTSR
jgi:hypothetical protein